MMKATHSGHCQACGRLQKLPDGKLAKHGYTIAHGFFSGTCVGSHHLPFEVSCDLLPRFIEAAKTHLLGVESFQAELRKPATEPVAWFYSWRCEVMLDSIDMQTLTDLGLRFEVHKIKGTMAVQALVPPTSPAMPGQATTVYVQVPHIGLLMIREVQLEENCCTDRLQKMLDDGWMILCVCPPNAQRRPDYILGRAKKED